MAWIDYAASGSIFFHAVRFLAKRKRGKSGTNGVEGLEEVVVVEVAASNKVPNPVPIQLR